MASNRIGRINEEIQRELADQLRRLKDPRVSQVGMVSITRVDTTGDLRYSKIYVSVLDKNQEKDVLKGLKSASGFLRRELGDGVWKFSLRTGERVNATEVCRLLGGGGHARAAGATLEGVTQAEAEGKMLDAIARIVPDFKK